MDAHQAYRLDVADRVEVDAVAARIDREHGALDVLVNNAGVGMTGPYARMTADEWAFIRSINLDGVVNGCSAFTPPMLSAGRGHVVNVSSGLAFLPTAGESAYAATKAAVLQLSLCLRADWAAHGRRRDRHLSRLHQHLHPTDGPLHRRPGGPRGPRSGWCKGFSRAHPPEKVGAAIVHAIAANRAMVPVGFESVLGWYAHRCMPIALQADPGPPGRTGAEERLVPSLHLPRSRRSLLAVGAAAAFVGGAAAYRRVHTQRASDTQLTHGAGIALVRAAGPRPRMGGARSAAAAHRPHPGRWHCWPCGMRGAARRSSSPTAGAAATKSGSPWRAAWSSPVIEWCSMTNGATAPAPGARHR